MLSFTKFRHKPSRDPHKLSFQEMGHSSLILLLSPLVAYSFTQKYLGSSLSRDISLGRLSPVMMAGSRKRRRRGRRSSGDIQGKDNAASGAAALADKITIPIQSNGTSAFDGLEGLSEDPTDERYAEAMGKSTSSTSFSMPPPDFGASSKLKPLSGTTAERRQAYEEKNFIQRTIEEYTAPTPAGQEPKLIKLGKTITWVSVLLLVLIEIFVSIKVGGAPFSREKISFGG